MTCTEHASAAGFLAVAQPTLERHEAANGLMLGIALRLIDDPCHYGSAPFMVTIADGHRLQLAALMTPPYKLQLLATGDLEPACLDVLADALQRGGWKVPAVIGQIDTVEAFAAVWRRRTGLSVRAGMGQGVYELRQVNPLPDPPGEFRQAGDADREIVCNWARRFHAACFDDDRAEASAQSADAMVTGGKLYLWIDGEPVSMAARTRPTPHGEAVGFVFTPPEHRRRGYATAVVARLSQRILEEGRQFCTLYTDLSNPTSNHIYRRIGYRQVGEVIDIHFPEPTP